jgi:hypothetical protein
MGLSRACSELESFSLLSGMVPCASLHLLFASSNLWTSSSTTSTLLVYALLGHSISPFDHFSQGISPSAGISPHDHFGRGISPSVGISPHAHFGRGISPSVGISPHDHFGWGISSSVSISPHDHFGQNHFG